MIEGADKMNQDIQSWAQQTTEELKRQFAVLDIKHVKGSPSKQSSREAIINRYRRMQGVISRVSFAFPRHMVFVHKGVGKGVTISLAGSSATTRKPKPWFDPVIEQRVEQLADAVAENGADMVVNNLKIG